MEIEGGTEGRADSQVEFSDRKHVSVFVGEETVKIYLPLNF
jgi:hypothetical protein